MDISIIIVNYKSKGHTLNCLRSIEKADFEYGGRKLSHEIIVVDNDSRDFIGDILKWQHPSVIFMQNNANLGMGAGNNRGIGRARGEFAVIMNPDTIVFKDTFAKLHEFMSGHKRAGIAAPQLLYPNRTVQVSRHRWQSLMTPLYRRTFLGNSRFAKKDLDRFLMTDIGDNEATKADWIQGSFLFCRKSALKEVGGFDERFFMYMEDTDLCRKMWARGWEVFYYPPAKIIHNHARASAAIPWYAFFLSKHAKWHVVSWMKYVIKWGVKDRRYY